MCRIADLPMGNARGPKVRENSARPSTRLATGKEPGQWRATARASPAKASHPANALAAIDQVAGKSMSMAHGEHRRPHGHDDASTSALSSPEHVISYSIPGPDSPIPISGLNQPHPHLDRGEQVQAHEYIRTVNSGVQQRFATPRAQNPQRSLLSQR